MTHADDQGLLAMIAALPLVASSRPPYGPACGPGDLAAWRAAWRPGGLAARRPGGRKTARTPAAPAVTPYVYPSRFFEDFWTALPGPCE